MTADVFQTAVSAMHRGGVVAYPTEAVWGLGCDPWQQTAVEEILKLKQRPMEKGLIMVAADISQIEPLLKSVTAEQLTQLKASWPGPVTWLIPDPENWVPQWVKGEHSAVAIRISDHPVVTKLCRLIGKPIISTSANLAGEPELKTEQAVRQQFGDKLDAVVSGERGNQTKPSQIRDLITNQILR
ncbi:threonylcarbamoyl-AMP synthase [Endozoicomonas sp. SM1973]|uniref:Threonylcarbamoyl-AMP synthase n=1 Tax=Spartinivicinus marinus TaxID=2994442 RepID=A0A853IA48_9GAMM|nr:L-threonylcarbamoyladenylate synthase [Spartinivicinus marinus]MCX4026924.1 L-threonylcarbamoyladenylate synthase [Spartinivicinus marinus]NYZ66731.1 threonylcarbamoyl-AMP synthase [Spartinivicinus marinus]